MARPRAKGVNVVGVRVEVGVKLGQRIRAVAGDNLAKWCRAAVQVGCLTARDKIDYVQGVRGEDRESIFVELPAAMTRRVAELASQYGWKKQGFYRSCFALALSS